MPPYYPPRKKQQLFFVDTKTTCFLCLQDIPPEPAPISVVAVDNNDDDGYVVELKLLLEERKTEKKLERVCLRSICKLLQMDAGELLKKKLTAGPVVGSSLANTDLTVVLCNSCLEVTTQLSRVFSEWEILQMKLDDAVSNFTQVLNNSEKDAHLIAELQKKLLDPVDLQQGHIAEMIRKETLNKCYAHLRKSWPKVVVVASGPRCTQKHNCLPTSTNQNELPSTSDWRQRSIKVEIEQQQTSLSCKLCPAQDKSENFSTETDLNRHLLDNHPYYFFESVRHGDCSKVKFRKVCEKLVNHEILSAQPAVDGIGFKCSYCPTKYHDKWGMHHHMVKKHFRIYTDKLAELQRNDDDDDDGATKTSGLQYLDTKKSGPVPTANNIDELPYQCEVCSERFPHKNVLFQHKRKHYSEDPFTTSNYEYPHICPDCGKGFILEKGLFQHQNHCLIAAHNPFRCQKCGLGCKTKDTLRRHYCRKSRDIDTFAATTSASAQPVYTPAASHQVDQLATSSTSANIPANVPTCSTSVPATATCHCRNCGQMFTNRKSLYLHNDNRRHYCPYDGYNVESGSVVVFKCQDCQVEFRLHSSLREHVAAIHLKIVGADGSGRCKCGGQYRDILDHIRRQTCTAYYPVTGVSSAHITNKPTVRPMTKVSCQYCNTVLSCSGALSRHQKKHCPLATKARAHTAPAPTPIINSINLMQSASQQVIPSEHTSFEEEEEPVIESNQNVAKVEVVVESNHEQIFGEACLEQGDMVMIPDEPLVSMDFLEVTKQENNAMMDYTSIFPMDQDDGMEQNVKNANTSPTMMILPDDTPEDPLRF